MVNFIKKLANVFRVKNPTVHSVNDYSYDEELVEKLESLGRCDYLEKLIKDPVCRIYVINTYSIDITELGSLLISARYNRTLRAVNMFTYFKGNENRATTIFTKIAQLVRNQRCTSEGIRDLNELIDTIHHLKTLKGIPL